MTEEELMAEQKRLFDNAKNYDYDEGGNGAAGNGGGDNDQQQQQYPGDN